MAVTLLRCAVDVGVLGAEARVGRRRWWALGLSSCDGGLLCEEVGELVGDAGEVVRHVFPGQGDGRLLVQGLREREQRDVVGVVPLAVVDLGSAEDGACECQRGPSHDGGLGGNEVAVVQGDLADVGSHVLYFPRVPLLGNDDLGEEVDGWVTNIPLERVEDVHLHLREHACVVKATAHVVELIDLRYPVLLVPILSSDQKCRTADQLVVLLVDHSLRAVSIKKVDS